MKLTSKIKIVLLVVILYLCASISCQVSDEKASPPGVSNANAISIKDSNSSVDSQDNSNLEDDESFFYDEQDFFSRKMFQKKLPPIKNDEKVKWAFRMANSNVYQ